MKNFIKNFGIMLFGLALIITCVGAISTGDAVFVTTGIISSLFLAYHIGKFIRENSGGYES